MKKLTMTGLSRRAFLAASGGALCATALPVPSVRAGTTAVQEYRLRAGPASASMVGSQYPETEVWAYNGRVPGPEIRVRQGERVRILVENRLAEETTVHWHGVRVPNPMDGVPHLTQKPIAPGETFVYEFDAPDAGTYWYHPHQRSLVQVGRGLYGPLIVEERAPVDVDRDLTWVIDDWRLNRDAQIAGDFGNMMDMGMAGRIGNTVTVNGRLPEPFNVRAGERVRLRLINAANARIFGLVFRGHRPLVVAIDGQPVAPHEPPNGRVVLAPAMRIDLMVDMTGAPGEVFKIRDTFYAARTYTLTDIVYSDAPPLPKRVDPPAELPPNTMPEPDLDRAERHTIAFGGGMMGMMGGGMMGGGMMGGGMMGGGMMGRRGGSRGGSHAGMWTVNGISATGHLHDPFLHFKLGGSYVLAMHNNTAWHHPIHLHGHSFRVIARNGRSTRHREWQDTVLMDPDERVDIAFVADNPGDWMIHCHILEHQEGGMMGVIRVG
jgi:FtsP/CotA-like multicopper oxidase with cupredoxin domain